MEPQSEAAEALQLRSQLTPRFAGSLLTVAANCVEEFAATDDGGAICPCVKAMVTGAGLLTLHPLNGKSDKPHNIKAMLLSATIIRPFETDSQFISIISGSSLPCFRINDFESSVHLPKRRGDGLV
jgi:hypothetical protein